MTVRENGDTEIIRQTIINNPDKTLPEIREASGVRDPTFKTLLSRLVSAGQVIKTTPPGKDGKPGRKSTYHISPDYRTSRLVEKIGEMMENAGRPADVRRTKMEMLTAIGDAVNRKDGRLIYSPKGLAKKLHLLE